MLVVLVLVLLYVIVGPLMGRMIRIADSGGVGSRNWAQLDRLFELVGGGSGLIIIVIVWLIVTKPS